MRVVLAWGTVAGSLVFTMVLVGVVAEAQQMWRKGAAVFFSDAGLRLGFGLCIALLHAAPYVLVAKASRMSGPPVFFAIAGMSMVAFHLWSIVYMTFFARSSTAPLALVFIPLYLGAPAVAIFMAAALARQVRSRRHTG